MLRRLFKPLLGALLALIGVLAPVESPDLPDLLDGLIGTAPVRAQTPPPMWVESGDPSDCPVVPAPWSPQPGDANDETASECVLETSACPASRIYRNQYMILSMEYPNFCEESVNEAVDSVLYNQCTNQRGVAMLRTGPSGNRICRLVYPATCSDGMHRVSAAKCRAVRRRTWECNGLIPRNEFNTCYQRPPDHTSSTHPACGAGAPEFKIGSCDDFVGQDFFRGPSSPSCTRFNTGSSSSAMGASRSGHWCRYNASWLNVGCHGPGVACAHSEALCVKRASRTGGCDATANTIRCRSLQAAFAAGSTPADTVYVAGCEPCATIPFQPVPADCPENFSREPARGPRRLAGLYDATHRVEQDFRYDAPDCQSVREGGPMTDACKSESTCADPPRGRLTWTSTHYSRVAIVNAPAILTVRDIPFQTWRRHHTYDWRTRRSPIEVEETPALRYPDGSFAVRLWPSVGGTVQPGSMSDLVGDGECTFREPPQFRAIVEELWPDNPEHYAEIERLFGADALDWWDALASGGTTDQQEDHTAARGLGWWPDLAGAGRLQRTEDLRQEVGCNVDADTWCRWTPARTGYYRLKAAGAWRATRYDSKIWFDPNDDFNGYFNNLIDYLSDADNRTTMSRELSDLGRTPAELGLTSDLMGVLPLPPNTANWVYADPGTYRTACPTIDLRFICSSGTGVANYTETEYIGVQVHEIRVSTVTPSR